MVDDLVDGEAFQCFRVSTNVFHCTIVETWPGGGDCFVAFGLEEGYPLDDTGVSIFMFRYVLKANRLERTARVASHGSNRTKKFKKSIVLTSSQQDEVIHSPCIRSMVGFEGEAPLV
jgi:hypothetical protein